MKIVSKFPDAVDTKWRPIYSACRYVVLQSLAKFRKELPVITERVVASETFMIGSINVMELPMKA